MDFVLNITMNNMKDPVIQDVNDYIEECERFNKVCDCLAEYFNDNLNGFFFCADNNTIYGFETINSALEFIQNNDECQRLLKEIPESEITIDDIEWIFENSDFQLFHTKEKAEQFFVEHTMENDVYELEEW